MPFGEEFSELYELGIKTACEKAGAYCERVDEQIFNESILARIYNQIAKADIIVSDMSNRNPNVFYETGYAHALNKEVILLTQSVEDIPFDLKHYPHIVYEGKIIPLRDQLEPRIRWCVNNPRTSLAAVDVNLELFINRISLEHSSKVIASAAENSYGRRFSLSIGVHNRAPKVVNPRTYSVALVLPDIVDIQFEKDIMSSPTWMADGRQILNINITDTLFPDGWCSRHITCQISKHKLTPNKRKLVLSAIMRLFTELGPLDFPFNVELKLLKSGDTSTSWTDDYR
jgi:hypothetical protein